MEYKDIPDKITAGQKVKCCALSYDGNEVLEIVKVDDDGKIILRREDGLVVRGVFRRQDLIDFDYKLVVEK